MGFGIRPCLSTHPPDVANYLHNGIGRHNPIGKVFTGAELLAIGNLCVEHNIIMLSDEVSLDRP